MMLLLGIALCIAGCIPEHPIACMAFYLPGCGLVVAARVSR